MHHLPARLLLASLLLLPAGPGRAWDVVRAGAAHARDYAELAVRTPGGVLVVGGELGRGGAVLGLDPEAGAELWRAPITPDDLAVAPGGVAGLERDAVFRLRGADGGELWRVAVDGGSFGGRALAVDAAGDVAVAGEADRGEDGRFFAVAKLSGADGGLLWRYEPEVAEGAASDGAEAVGFLPGATSWLPATSRPSRTSRAGSRSSGSVHRTGRWCGGGASPARTARRSSS